MHLPCARSHSHASKLAANFVDQCFVQCKEKEKEKEKEREREREKKRERKRERARARARAKEKEQEKEREREERETRIEGKKEKRREEEGKNEREQERERRENPPVCTFKTPPCVRSGRLRVYRQRARMSKGIDQVVGGRVGIPPPHLGCLWCSRQCRCSSWTRFPCPCCATTRAHGARDSAGAVRSSSCGAHRGVVHSPFEWLYHRCHYNCRDLVLFVGRLLWLCGPFVLRECLRRDVVWWWTFLSWWCLRFRLGQCEADDWKILLQLFPVPRVRWVCMHAGLLVQQQ